MTTTALTAPVRSANTGRRLQAGLAIAALGFSVAVTAVLVATPSPVTLGGSRTPSAPSPVLPADTRVEVRGGDPFEAYDLADRLEASGGEVVAVAPVAEGRAVAEETVVVYYERRSMDTALRVRDMLGRGTLRRQQVFAPQVDVTIVLGKDL